MTPTPVPMTVLKSLTALRLDINIWSGCRKLTPADLASSSLPPERLASLGSKKVCNPEALRIFTTLKNRAVAVLDRCGVRFLGGWLLPDTQIAALVPTLNRLADDFASAREAFLASYDESIRAWIADNPGWEDLIARSLVREDVVRSRLHFGWQMFKVTPPRRADVGHSLVQTVQGLGGTLLEDVRRIAAEIWTKSYAGKTTVSAKALSPLRMLRQKMAGLHFLEPRILPIVDLMDEALNQMPERGPIKGRDLIALQGVLCLLQNPATVLEHGQALLDGESPQAMLGALGSLPMDDMPPAFVLATSPCPDSLGLW